MKRRLILVVGIAMAFPDDTTGVCAPMRRSPLGDLAARLRDEACCGRDCRASRPTSPDVTVWMAAAYEECFD